ncbi:hypothetical protein SD80_009150 [Scytonema tolypothrichoides VB-61278]|nr:hypothetical protein SD80_009150 [Scytonema tolypothrichoides VB-61278]
MSTSDFHLKILQDNSLLISYFPCGKYYAIDTAAPFPEPAAVRFALMGILTALGMPVPFVNKPSCRAGFTQSSNAPRQTIQNQRYAISLAGL